MGIDRDGGTAHDGTRVGVGIHDADAARWTVAWTVEKYHGDVIAPAFLYETVAGEGNILLNGGISCLFQSLIGNGTATAAQTLTYFNNGNAYLGVGDSTTAAAATQTDLQASTNKTRKAMDATYPQHTDGTTSGAATITFKSTFATTDANYSWQEWGIFNGSSGGRMLNRKVTDMGSKTSVGQWVLTVTITLS
ncbi:hypothetical protein [Frankia sp. CIT1]|uniref:hypothetical protein n=1 Tax=Frankia sp. CIT1 TaxID=2880974 RepID=UPI001EF3DC04|nr:hypothetical protein [Frankia sp. CIT1]